MHAIQSISYFEKGFIKYRKSFLFKNQNLVYKLKIILFEILFYYRYRGA